MGKRGSVEHIPRTRREKRTARRELEKRGRGSQRVDPHALNAIEQANTVRVSMAGEASGLSRHDEDILLERLRRQIVAP
jgi:hypothetical protein